MILQKLSAAIRETKNKIPAVFQEMPLAPAEAKKNLKMLRSVNKVFTDKVIGFENFHP